MVAVNLDRTGPRLKSLEFIVEIMDQKQQQRIRNEIITRDGKIVDYVNERKLPYMVISDHPVAKTLEKMSHTQQKHYERRLPLLLRDAVQNRVKICSAETFLRKLTQKRLQKQHEGLSILSTKESPYSRNSSVQQTTTIKPGFTVKIEDFNREHQPIIKKLEQLPVMHVGKEYGISLFHRADDQLRSIRGTELRKEKEDCDYGDANSHGALIKARDKITGHCEICGRKSSNLIEHYRSKEHLRNTSKAGFYDELDECLGSYTIGIKCPGRPALLKKPKTPSPNVTQHDFSYGESEYSLEDDD